MISQIKNSKVYEQHLTPKDYGQPLRQIAISSSGRSKPALIITNDLTLATEQIVRKYARRWLVEKGISQQIEFFPGVNFSLMTVDDRVKNSVEHKLLEGCAQK